MGRWGALFFFILIARLCHKDVVWVEEAYPLAAALEILRGKIIYRDFWFDKPPLFAYFYTWFGAEPGWKLRLAGTLLIVAACVAAYRLARSIWSAREGMLAAWLTAFFLTFGIPAAVLAAAPDLLMIAPHLAAIGFAVAGQPLPAGVACGIALLVNPKAFLVVLACLLWQWRKAHWLVLGVAIVCLPVAAWLAAKGAWEPFLEQVWRWGAIYSRDTFVERPWLEGLRRTWNWAGFQAALVVGAALWAYREDSPSRKRQLLLWVLISFAGVCAGLRFFPRYYFFVLAPLVVLAARGWLLIPRRWLAVLAVLLAIPLVRFGPRYVQLAAGVPWQDLALHNDARAAADYLRQRKAGSVLVWGYRPEVYAYSRVPAATPWLDSQPLTGVMADRHLTSATPSAPEVAAANRAKLVAYTPEVIVDGLGPLNPALAITRYPDLATWMGRYQLVKQSGSIAIYELRTRTLP